MAYLTDDELLDTEDGFTEWDEDTAAGSTEETLEQALAGERLAELESELEQDEHPVDYDTELETEEEEAAPVSEKRLKREMRAEAIRRLEEAARTEKDFRAVVEEWNKLDRNRAVSYTHLSPKGGRAPGASPLFFPKEETPWTQPRKNIFR